MAYLPSSKEMKPYNDFEDDETETLMIDIRRKIDHQKRVARGDRYRKKKK